jgi:hypothetical protein
MEKQNEIEEWVEGSYPKEYGTYEVITITGQRCEDTYKHNHLYNWWVNNQPSTKVARYAKIKGNIYKKY